jgi:probable HAF family extracellular repeat protein
MNFQRKMMGVLLVGLFCLASLSAVTNEPPRYRLQRIEDWDDYGYPETLLLNNRNQLAAMVQAEDGPHFFIRGPNKTVEILMTPEAPADSLLVFNGNGTAILQQIGFRSAYRYRKGKFVNLTNFAPYKYFNTVAINNRGRIVGGAQRQDGPPITTFSYYRSRHRVLKPLLPGTSSLAFAINNHGVVVGAAQYETNETDFVGSSYHAVIFKRGKAQDIGTLDGDLSSVATGINDRGAVIGYSSSRQPVQDGEISISRGFIYRDGIMSPLQPLPGQLRTRPESINRRGLIVGHSSDENFERTAVLFLNGQTYDLNNLVLPETNPKLSEATSINDRGVIAARNDDGEPFLLFPE